MKNRINEQTKKQKQTYRYREQTDNCQVGEEWAKKVKGINQYTLLVIKLVMEM